MCIFTCVLILLVSEDAKFHCLHDIVMTSPLIFAVYFRCTILFVYLFKVWCSLCITNPRLVMIYFLTERNRCNSWTFEHQLKVKVKFRRRQNWCYRPTFKPLIQKSAGYLESSFPIFAWLVTNSPKNVTKSVVHSRNTWNHLYLYQPWIKPQPKLQSCEMSQIWQIYLCKNIGMLG